LIRFWSLCKETAFHLQKMRVRHFLGL